MTLQLPVPVPVPVPNCAIPDWGISVNQQHRFCAPASQHPPRRPGAFSAEETSGTQGFGVAEKERLEVLWQRFFLDPTQWWDNRADKKSSRHPDFRHKTSKQALWLEDCFKPGWVDLELELASWVPSGREDGPQDERLRVRCEEAELREAVEALAILVQEGAYVDTSLLYCLLKRCIAEEDLILGRRVHALVLKSGYESNAFLGNHIMGMYVCHGKLAEAVRVLDDVTAPDAYMWATIILGHVRHGQPVDAMRLYRRMRYFGVEPDNHVFVAVLKACAVAEDLDFGKEVHADIFASFVRVNTIVGNSLVNMYAKCGSLDDARLVFDELQARDVVTWTAMIAGYAQRGMGQEALDLYADMQQEGIIPVNHVTYVCLLKACASVQALHQGKQLHVHIQQRGLETNVPVANCLVDMYSKCGNIEDARKVFDSLPTRDEVTWSAMISGYTQQGLGGEALALYSRMKQEYITPADPVTFLCIMQACASVGALHPGKELHVQIEERGMESDEILGSCLVDMYVKCGSLENARRVFNRLPSKTMVTWTAMVAGCVQHGLGREALGVYSRMLEEGVTPTDSVTFVCLLQACASVGALQQGRQLHSQIFERGLEGDVFTGSCLVDMYAKCGSLESARQVFDRLLTKNVVTWNALLAAYAEHGDGQGAMSCVTDMRQQGFEPNEATFVCVLVACSHGGLVHEGREYFRMMVEDYNIMPTDDHYNCLVDLLGRSGCLNEAEDMMYKVQLRNYLVGWTSLLSACKSHSDIERGKRCFDRLVKLEPGNAGAYVLMGTIYASAGRWTDVDRIENLRKVASAWKKPAKVCIEVMNKVHEFTVGEERTDISSTLKTVSMRLKEGGHKPQTDLVLKAASEQEKEDALCGHAEKLALAYGLLNTPDGTTLIVTKNLRMCNDCHSSTKLLSSLEKRQIIVRDAHRVHHFLDGSCSCRDLH